MAPPPPADRDPDRRNDRADDGLDGRDETRRAAPGGDATVLQAAPPAAAAGPAAPTAVAAETLLTPAAGSGGLADGAGLAPGETAFGRYLVERELGRGGMGAVYLALDTQLNRPVALKIPSAAAAADEELSERFLTEARAAATLRHPNLCPVYDAGEAEAPDGSRLLYITMAYLPGESLRDVADGPRAVRSAVRLIATLADAMAHAHARGVIHRDLKPGNVMLDEDGRPSITDFGLARRQTDDDQRITRTGATLGTPAYMSPEQIAGRADQIGPRTDVYALGVMLYELLTGRLPFEGPATAVMARAYSEDPRPPGEVRAEEAPDLPPVPAAVEAVWRRMVARDPADRFASMAEVKAALADSLEPGVSLWESRDGVRRRPAPTARIPAAEPPVKPRRRPNAVRWGAAALVGLAAVAAAAVLFRPPAPAPAPALNSTAGDGAPRLEPAAGTLPAALPETAGLPDTAGAAVETDAAAADTTDGEWIDLLAGGSLEGWDGDRGRYALEDGVLTTVPTPTDVHGTSLLYAPGEYGDIRVRAVVRSSGRRATDVLEFRGPAAVPEAAPAESNATATGVGVVCDETGDGENRTGALWSGDLAVPQTWSHLLAKNQSAAAANRAAAVPPPPADGRPRDPDAPEEEPEAWDLIEAEVRGREVSVSVNGVPVNAHRYAKLPAAGRIGVRHSGSFDRYNQFQVREFRVRPLAPPPPPDRTPDADGWVEYVNGSLEGWTGDALTWRLEDGLLVSEAEPRPSSDTIPLLRRELYGNVEIRVVYAPRSWHYEGVLVRQVPGVDEGVLVYTDHGSDSRSAGPHRFGGRVRRLGEPTPVSSQNLKDRSAAADAAATTNGEPDGFDVLRVRVVGDRVWGYRNGVLMDERQIPDLPPLGQIGLRAVGIGSRATGAAYRSFRIRRLDENGDPVLPEPGTKKAEDTADGEVTDLLAGGSLDGWVGDVDQFTLEDGVLSVTLPTEDPGPDATRRGAVLLSPEAYGDVRIRAVVRSENWSSNGFGLRESVEDAEWGVKVNCGTRPNYENHFGSLMRQDEGEPRVELRPSDLEMGLVVAARADNGEPAGWDVLEVDTRGRRVTSRVNGVPVNDYRFDRLRPRGRLTVQAWQSKAGPNRFEVRDLTVRPLPPAGGGASGDADAPPLPAADADGWVDLFDGRTLDGWTGDLETWRVEDGLLRGRAEPAPGEPERLLRHHLPLGDAEFRLVYRPTRWYFSGLLARWDWPRDRGVLVHTYNGYENSMGGVLRRLDGRPGPPARAPRGYDEAFRRLAENGEPDGWDVLTVRVVGKEVRSFRNGVPLVTEVFESLPDRGSVGLRLVSVPKEPSEMEVRSLRVRLLDENGSSRPAAASDAAASDEDETDGGETDGVASDAAP